MRVLGRAKARLDTLDYYPKPINIDRVRVLYWPWLFKLPWFKRWAGFAGQRTVLLKYDDNEDLMVHELCHIWQAQQLGWWDSWTTWMRYPYATNPLEIEARKAMVESRKKTYEPLRLL